LLRIIQYGMVMPGQGMLPPFQVDPDSDLPIYRQLSDHIKESVRSGAIAAGERLPATRELAGLLGLNRTTVSAAYELLENEGLIRGHVGRGSFVAARPAGEHSRLDWARLTEEFDEIAGATLPRAGEEHISFATSRPAEELFPVDEFRLCCDEALRAPHASSILQLGSPGGYPPLRHYLAGEARREGVLTGDDDLMVTSGCQQGLDLVARVLVRAGDAVAVEDPVYPGLRNTFFSRRARLVGIPVGPRGMDVEALDRALGRDNVRLVVVTPDFQNPTGESMPAESRAALLRVARKAQAAVIENDIYGELRYEGDRAAPLKRMDENSGVALLRSFSKIAFPGLRVGWIVAPRALVARMMEAKQWTDLHTDQLSQAALLRFAESGRLEAHRRRIVAAGREKLAAAVAACEKYLPAGTRFTKPQGGMSLWVRLPEPLDAAELAPRVQREGVSYLAGRYFEVTRRDPGALRLSFAGLAPAEITEGIAILGKVFRKELERVRGRSRPEPATAIV
jgi:2-aminoadipate transaminase